MLKKFSRFFIVAMIEMTVLVLALFFLSPYLLDAMESVSNMSLLLKSTILWSFFLRLFAYGALFFAWPYIAKRLIQNPSAHIIGQLRQARFIFIGALLAIETFYCIGKL